LKREVPVTHIHRRSGFTLIELMLVVAIIGLLAAIAVPKFANLVIKAKEASTRGKLGTVRSALSIYYADNEGRYPFDDGSGQALAHALLPKYLSEIPRIEVPTVPAHILGNQDTGVTPLFNMPEFGGPTCYAFRTTATMPFQLTGEIKVACTHTDTKGTTWSLY